MEWTHDYIRIPFKDKGRDEKGVDCWGLVRLILRDHLGAELPSYLELYGDTEDAIAIERAVVKARKDKSQWIDVPYDRELCVNESRPFDVVIMRMRNMPLHVGIVVDDKSLIHCLKGRGVATEDFARMAWEHNILGFSRWTGSN